VVPEAQKGDAGLSPAKGEGERLARESLKLHRFPPKSLSAKQGASEPRLQFHEEQKWPSTTVLICLCGDV
jgi:hypothetical protein